MTASVTILKIVQDACVRTGLPSPSSAVGNTDQNVAQMLSFVNKIGNDLHGQWNWPEFEKEYLFTLVNGIAAYALPADFNAHLFDTQWSRNDYWPLIGPITKQEWQYRKSGISTISPRSRFMMRGYSTTQINITPTPGTSDAGKVYALEYFSSNWIRPTTVWSSSLSVAAITYVYYGANVYKKSSGSTTGATPPTHQTGIVTDGGVLWEAIAYDQILADTDVVNLAHDLIVEGARYLFKREKGLDYKDLERGWLDDVEIALSSLRGARTLSLLKPNTTQFITPWSVPDSGYGS
jgi:hypothetical protein